MRHVTESEHNVLMEALKSSTEVVHEGELMTNDYITQALERDSAWLNMSSAPKDGSIFFAKNELAIFMTKLEKDGAKLDSGVAGWSSMAISPYELNPKQA